MKKDIFKIAKDIKEKLKLEDDILEIIDELLFRVIINYTEYYWNFDLWKKENDELDKIANDLSEEATKKRIKIFSKTLEEKFDECLVKSEKWMIYDIKEIDEEIKKETEIRKKYKRKKHWH